MQLETARLCMDCEEVHDLQQCPACASESFAFITRWVPAPERRAPPRPPEPQDPEGLDTYRQLLDVDRRATRWQLVRRGAIGLALFGVAGWAWRRTDQKQGARSAVEAGVSPRGADTAPKPATDGAVKPPRGEGQRQHWD